MIVLQKKKYSKRLGNKARFTKFLDEHEDFIIYSAFWFEVSIFVSGDFEIGEFGQLSDVIYTYLRNPLLHEGEVGDDIMFLDSEAPCAFGFEKGRLIVSQHLIMGLLLLVVGDPVNRGLSFKRQWLLDIKGTTLDLNEMWGKLPLIKKALGYKDMPPNFFEDQRKRKEMEKI